MQLPHQQQLRFYKMVANISASFVAAKENEIDQNINCALAQIGEFFQADRSYVFSFSEKNKVGDNTHEWCAEDVEPQLEYLQNIPLDAFSEWVDDWQRGEISCISDVSAMPAESPMRQLLEPQGIQSVIMLPLRNERGVVGMFGLDLVKVQLEWNEEHTSLLSIVAETIANAIARKDAALSFQLQQSVGNLVVSFINVPSASINSTINEAFLHIQRDYGFQYVELLSPKIGADNLAIDSVNNPHYQPAELVFPEVEAKYAHYCSLKFPVQHGSVLYGFIALAHSNQRIFESKKHRSALQLIANAIAGSLARRDTEQENKYLSFHDALTGLSNRRFMESHINQLVNNTERHEEASHEYECTRVAALILDIERFKHINDTFSREKGDQVLRSVADRLQELVSLSPLISSNNLVGRIGPDQFAVFVNDISFPINIAQQEIEIFISHIKIAFETPFIIDNKPIIISLAIGVSMGVSCDEQTIELLNQAELAMLKAKSIGTGAVRYFNEEMQDMASNRGQLYDDLKQAVLSNQFVVFYQLQVNKHGMPEGAEALVRWQHPLKGTITPNDFIPFAEETYLIHRISEHVLLQACQQLYEWSLSADTAHLDLSINISASHMLSDGFVTTVKRILQSTKVPTRLLKFEITESAMIADPDTIIKLMHELTALGIRFSLDDFGTGYSSLSHLNLLPIKELKLDISFVRDILHSTRAKAIASAVITLAKDLQLSVVAEGIETEEQRDLLIGLGCNRLQGYLYSKPTPAAELILRRS